MPQPRKYKSNAERQAAYRRRKAAAEATSLAISRLGQERTNQEIARFLAADARAAS